MKKVIVSLFGVALVASAAVAAYVHADGAPITSWFASVSAAELSCPCPDCPNCPDCCAACPDCCDDCPDADCCANCPDCPDCCPLTGGKEIVSSKSLDSDCCSRH
jgi:hypothetical protein